MDRWNPRKARLAVEHHSDVGEGMDRAVPVLVVEDEVMQRRVLVKLLESWGFRAIEAGDGLAAVEILGGSSPRPRLILLDLMLPFLDGLEVARRVRSSWPEIPIIACSAILQGPIEEELRRSGVCGFLPKPFSASSLRLEVLRHLGVEHTNDSSAN